MVVLPTVFYQHVVNVDLNIRFDLVCEHLVHEPLIRCACVLEAKRHHFVIKKALASNEWSFLLIHLIHSDLVIIGKDVHKA